MGKIKHDRNSKEYQLAERIVFLEEALQTANDILNKNNLLGVLPNRSVSFRGASKHHSKVRKTLEKF